MCLRCQYWALQSPMTNLKKYLRFIIRQTCGSPDRWNNNFLLIWLLTFLKTQCVFANPTYVNRLEKHCTAVWQSNTATYDNRKKGQLVTKLLGWAGHICSVAHPNQEQNIYALELVHFRRFNDDLLKSTMNLRKQLSAQFLIFSDEYTPWHLTQHLIHPTVPVLLTKNKC